MARTAWSEVAIRPGSFFLLTGHLHDDFAGGAKEAFDTLRLRLASDLMKRSCTKLHLRGDAAVQGSRGEKGTVVRVAVVDAADFVQLNSLTISTLVTTGDWKGQSHFVLDEALHSQLLEVAGLPDERSRGRRARERLEAEIEDRTLRWKVSGRSRD
jgi:hypothetical protein